MKINGHAFAGGGLRLLLVLSLLGCLLLPAASRADTRLTIVNPLSGDNISLTGARTSATPGGAPYTVYVINGTCHQADNVLITVTPTNPAGPAVFVNDPATIKGGVWEYNWHIPSGTPAGAYRIDAVLVTGTIPGSTASATVTLDATTPGLALNFLPSTVHNLVYAGTTVGVGNNSGDFPAPSPNGVLLLPIQLQLVTPSAFPYTAFATLSAPNSNSIIAKIVVDNAPGTTPITQFNNDGPPQPTADPHIFTVDGLPASFTVGSNGGLVAGLNTVSTAATVSSGGGAMSASSTYRRSIIVDVTKPSIDTGLTISNVTTVKDATSAPRKNTLRISGMVHDPDNAAGVPGGIASVAVIVQPPAAANLPPERHTAHLAYGATPDAPVSWTLDYNTSGKSGDYKFYALISDYAGNVTLDPVQTHTLDTTAPDVSALTITPAPNQGVTSGTITFTGSVNDADTTAGNYVSWKIQVATHGGGSFTPLPGTSLVVANSTSASISLPFSTEGLADGHYDFKITGTDRSGNSADGPVLSDIIVVNTAPKVTLALSPGDSTKPIAGVITLVGTITTPIADKDILDSFKLERLSSNGVPDVPPANVTTSSSFAGGVTTVTFTWNTMPTGLASAPSGIYSLQLSATDKAKHTRRSEPVQLDVDTDAPIVTILSPAQGQTVPVGSLAVISVQDEHPDTSLPIATFTAKDTATGKTATNTFPVIVTNQAAGLFAVVIPTTVTDAADSSKVVSTIGNLVTLTITASDATLPTHNTSTAQVGFFGAVSDLQLSSATWTDDQNNPLTGALTSTTSVPPASATALAVRAAGIQIFGTVNVGSLFA
ncbi:MAG TPA: hypothetical protein VKT77_23525, partial [Chthonomonadaceae bacterium]|nr:hypothetical protein [Chthonomonadaceae bacterium]